MAGCKEQQGFRGCKAGPGALAVQESPGFERLWDEGTEVLDQELTPCGAGLGPASGRGVLMAPWDLQSSAPKAPWGSLGGWGPTGQRTGLP